MKHSSKFGEAEVQPGCGVALSDLDYIAILQIQLSPLHLKYQVCNIPLHVWAYV